MYPRILFLVSFFFVSFPAFSQTKPICVYGPNNSPSWTVCGTIGDGVSQEIIEAAYQRSVTTGFKWILQIGFNDDPRIPADIIALRNLIKFQKLMPHIVAVMYSEEWYEKFHGNHFAGLGLSSSNPEGIRIIYDWLGKQHLLIKKHINKPIIWMTTVVYWGAPVPHGVDIVAIEAYAGDNKSLAWAELRLLYAEIATDLPLVVVSRWFRNTGPKQGFDWQNISQPPTKEMVDLYFRILNRNRYIAMFGFLWESRPNADLQGLQDMPEVLGYVLENLRK